MEERSTGLIPEKTDQSNTDGTPRKPIGLSFLGGLTMEQFNAPMKETAVEKSRLEESRREKYVHYFKKIFSSPPVGSSKLTDETWWLQHETMLNSRSVWYPELTDETWCLHDETMLNSRSVWYPETAVENLGLEECEHNLKTKLTSRFVSYSKDAQINLLSDEMLKLEIEATVFLSRRNYSKYWMDKNLGEIKEKFSILSEYVSRISQGGSAACYNKFKIRRLLKDQKRLKSLIGRVCQGYRLPRVKYLPLNEMNKLLLQKSFNNKAGDGVDADPPQLSCSPEPKGKAMEVPSSHNSYEENLKKEWNSPDLCHSNDLRIKWLSEHALNLETEMGHVKDKIDSENKLDKRRTQEIQEKFKILAKHVHEIPSSGCNNPQLELLQKNHENLNSLIAEVIKPYSYGEDHGMANDDDHNLASPASSTTDTDQFTHQLGDKEMQDKKTKEHHEPQMVKNEADKCGHSSSHQRVIDIPPKNEAVDDDQEISNRLNAIMEFLSWLKHYFVDQNIGEEIPYYSLLVAALAALGKPFDLRSQETSPPRSLNEAFLKLGGTIVWSAIFFSIFIFTAIHVASRRRAVAVSFLGLFLTYYFLALANTTTGSSVPFGSVTISSFWFVLGGVALVFVLLNLLVMVLSAFLV